jgi:hypothetical protein
MPANSALTASESVSEFTGFGLSGFLVQIFGGPLAVALDAVTFVVSAVLVGSIRKPEPAPDPTARTNIRAEIAVGLRLVARQPLLRAITLASMATSALWGIFGAAWVIFAIEDWGSVRPPSASLPPSAASVRCSGRWSPALRGASGLAD